jgi:hypothetical protein
MKKIATFAFLSLIVKAGLIVNYYLFSIQKLLRKQSAASLTKAKVKFP